MLLRSAQSGPLWSYPEPAASKVISNTCAHLASVARGLAVGGIALFDIPDSAGGAAATAATSAARRTRSAAAILRGLPLAGAAKALRAWLQLPSSLPPTRRLSERERLRNNAAVDHRQQSRPGGLDPPHPGWLQRLVRILGGRPSPRRSRCAGAGGRLVKIGPGC